MKEYRYKAQTIRVIITPAVWVDETGQLNISIAYPEQVEEFMRLSCMDEAERLYTGNMINETMAKLYKMIGLDKEIACYEGRAKDQDTLHHIKVTYQQCITRLLREFPTCNTVEEILKYFYDAYVVGDLTKQSYLKMIEFEMENGRDFVQKTLRDDKLKESLLREGILKAGQNVVIHEPIDRTQPLLVVPVNDNKPIVFKVPKK